MTQLLISELSAQSGVPLSTLRYYERIALVRPQARAANGYRLYDDDTVERLAFIGRAKRLGMSLGDIATLVDVWFAGECGPLQSRLRAFVSGRIAELRRQIADESAFEAHLQRILARLERTDTAPERCRPDCGCDTDPLDGPESQSHVARDENAPAESGPIACSLRDAEARVRIGEWQTLLASVSWSDRSERRARFVFDASETVALELARLCRAETVCCPFFEFSLEFTARTLVLTITGTGDDVDALVRHLAPGELEGSRATVDA